MTAKEMREMIVSRKKKDPRKEKRKDMRRRVEWLKLCKDLKHEKKKFLNIFNQRYSFNKVKACSLNVDEFGCY
jgi:hypothetical protein